MAAVATLQQRDKPNAIEREVNNGSDLGHYKKPAAGPSSNPIGNLRSKKLTDLDLQSSTPFESHKGSALMSSQQLVDMQNFSKPSTNLLKVSSSRKLDTVTEINNSSSTHIPSILQT